MLGVDGCLSALLRPRQLLANTHAKAREVRILRLFEVLGLQFFWSHDLGHGSSLLLVVSGALRSRALLHRKRSQEEARHRRPPSVREACASAEKLPVKLIILVDAAIDVATTVTRCCGVSPSPPLA